MEESQTKQKETITKQDDMIRQLMKEVEKLTKLVAMKSTNHTPNESEVCRILVEFDDSDDELILQDEPTKETAREESDDEFLEGLESLMQEEPENEPQINKTSTDPPSSIDRITSSYKEPLPRYKVPLVFDPFWEDFCQNKTN